MTLSHRLLLVCALLLAGTVARGQVIEFESGGLKYKTLTRKGVTIMFAQLNANVREYAILQVAVSNGSPASVTIQPRFFVFHRQDGTDVHAADAGAVITHLVEKAGREDVVKLVSAYEQGLYGIVKFRSTNGYEQRRQAALAEVASTKLKAAAAASAIALVETKLDSGDSTDGVVFFPTFGKPLGPGYLEAYSAGEVFNFSTPPAEPKLQPR